MKRSKRCAFSSTRPALHLRTRGSLQILAQARSRYPLRTRRSDCGRLACISISEGDTDKKRTKHIAKHFHFVKEKRAAGLVVLKYLATALQVADMFTKQIFPKHFERLRRVMMGHENFDDMCERYQDAKAAGDNVDDPKIYTVKPERNSNG